MSSNTANNNANVMAAFNAFVNSLSDEDKVSLARQIVSDVSVPVGQLRQNKTKSGLDIVRINQQPLDPVLVKKTLETQVRLVEAAKRREIVQRVVVRLYKDRPFTTEELEKTLAPISNGWENVGPMLNNILNDIGAKVIAKQRREGSKGRLLNLWTVSHLVQQENATVQ